MHLVPKPDRFERALWNTPGLRIFVTFMALVYCFERGSWLFGGVVLVAVALSLLNEYLPHLPAKKDSEAPQ